MRYVIDSCCKTDKGKVRKNNEDNFYYNFKNLKENHDNTPIQSFSFENKDHIMGAVFDGMGGEINGERASFLASSALKNYFETHANQDFIWDDYIEIANNDILKETPKGSIMGTTIAALFFLDEKISLCNLGDSRVYGIKNKKIVQLSVDHTTEELNKKMGIQASNRLTQHLGIPKSELKLVPYVNSVSYIDYDKLLICSDGLSNMLTNEEIEEILSNNPPLESTNKLIDKALENGGEDNITVMVFEIKEKKQNKKLALFALLSLFCILLVILFVMNFVKFRIIKDDYKNSITVGESYTLTFNKGEIFFNNDNASYKNGKIYANKAGTTIITIKDRKGKVLYEKQIKIFP